MAAKKDFFVYWDSCVFLSWLNGMPGRAEVIQNRWNEITQEKNGAILTSALTIAEVAHSETEGKNKRLDPDVETRISSMWQDPHILVIEAPRFIMESARSLMRDGLTRGWSLKAYDAVHLASAKFMDNNGFLIQEFNSYDRGFRKYTDLIRIDICEPHFEPPPPPPPKQMAIF